MGLLDERSKAQAPPDLRTYRARLMRLSVAADRAMLDGLLNDRPGLVIHDHIIGQLTELVRSLNPSKRFTPPELLEAARAHVNGSPLEEYGVWVYYPWNDRLVHILDESEFALVRTDRNRNKITREEQAVLSTKKVGVIGLSVGQSVSLTMALERSFGEIRLADFDTLELSNLNRIRSGVHELGVPKVINTAREIAELDPFLNVTIFPEGVTRDNVDTFLTDGGKLDVLVEECDSVDVKILARQRAKAFGIPVVMDTSDRGLIDVERFDLEPERPIMHGRMAHLDLSVTDKPMLPDQELEFILTMVGKETLSKKMLDSFPEIGKSLVTWPQLGAHVVLGGALAGDVCRNILLGQMSWSGRWQVDLDDLLAIQGSKVLVRSATEEDQEKDIAKNVS